MHSSRIIISTSSLEDSLRAWTAIGFEEQDRTDSAVRLTDGQILVTLMTENFVGPALAYFSADRDVTGTKTLPGDLTFFVHHRSVDQEEHPTGEQNPMLGYYDALVIGIADPVHARTEYERHGFFVQEEWGGQFPQSDVTDGLNVISLQPIGSKRYLAYHADDLEDLLTALDPDAGVTTVVNRDANGNITGLILSTTDNTHFFISPDLF